VFPYVFHVGVLLAAAVAFAARTRVFLDIIPLPRAASELCVSVTGRNVTAIFAHGTLPLAPESLFFPDL
jgi:hypothetical protein